MASVEHPNENERIVLQRSTGNEFIRADAVTYFWSVTLPRWLDPWSPRLAVSFADGAWTAPWRGVAAIAPLLALLIGFLVPQVWPGMYAVYTESLLFMALIIAGGIVSGPIGVMMLLGHIAAMAIWGSEGLPARAGHQEWLGYFLRRDGSLLISYLLLAIPAIIVPQQARWMAEEAPLPPKAGIAGSVGIRAILYAFGAGLLIYLWCQAMPVLIRPVFTWLGMAPRVEAIAPLQQHWQWIVGTAVVAAFVRIVLESVTYFFPIGKVAAELQEQSRAVRERRNEFWRNIPLPLREMLTASVITLLLSGLYTGWIDALLVVAIITVLESWRTGYILKFPRWWEAALLKVPALLRFVIALIVGYLLSVWILTPPWRGNGFRLVLFAALLTLVLFYLLFPAVHRVREQNLERT